MIEPVTAMNTQQSNPISASDIDDVNIHSMIPLWITLVENSVENVENYELSTDISMVSKMAPACGISVYRFA